MKDNKTYQAIGRIYEPRAHSHGGATNGFKAIAEGWSAYLCDQLKEPLSGVDVGCMMAILKIHRHKMGVDFNLDNFADGANYLALAGDIGASTPAEKEKANPTQV